MPAGIKEAYKSSYQCSNDGQGEYNTNYRLPDYKPSFSYPSLHPTDNSGPSEPSEAPYPITTTSTPFPTSVPQPKPDYDDLINQVLENPYCRRILRKLLADDSNKMTGGGGGVDSETIKHIIVYSLCGLLILCLLELFIKFGQIIRK